MDDGLTPAEEQELQQLQAEEQTTSDQTKGDQAVDHVDAQRLKMPAPHETRPFSRYRVVVGGLRDAAQNIFDFAEDAGDALERHIPLPVVRFGHDSSNGLVDVVTGQKAIEFTDRTRQTPELPQLRGSDNAGTTENILRALVSFAVPYTAVARTLGVAKAVSWLGRAGRAMAAGVVVDATMDPEKTNLANVLRDDFGIDSPMLNALASEPNDNRLEARFKAAAVNAPLSLATDAVFEAGLRGVRAYRAWRGSFEEANAAVEAATRNVPVHLPEDEGVHLGGQSADEAANAAKPPPEDPMRVTPEEHPQNAEDILDFLKRKAALGEMDPELLSRFAHNLAEGDPENALAKMGIDPLKMDFSALDDPTMLGRFHAGLAEIYEGIAKRLGRTGTRVTEAAIAGAARTLASTADVLKDLYGHTSNLAETMFASRLFVGAHAAKLVGEAQEALKALQAGAGDPEWAKFLESFQRHAYFLGALRGAGSEVGRALRQLQMVGKIGQKTLTKNVGEAVDSATKAHTAGGASQLALTATDAVSQMASPAERMAFLGRLIDQRGDIGDLSRFVRAKSGSVLTRLDSALGETRGNLFSTGTMILNTLSGLSMIGLRSIAKTTAAIARMALSPLGKNYSQAARIQLMESWAYADGALGAWRDAFRNTWALMEREGMEDVALNLQGVGLNKAAARAQSLAEKARQALTGEFERVDLSGHARTFAVTPADFRAINRVIESWNTPQLLEHSMKWLVRALAVPVNAAGSFSRLGTILFINASDQFVGTIAARAGAQAEAMRIAASEAAELQLEGKSLSNYMKARMIQLTETADGFAPDAYTAGRREAVHAAGELESRQVLFQDKLEFGASRALAGGLTKVPFFHMIVPFVRTPLRILERTAIDFTPLGLLKDRIRADIVAGGPRRDQALAQIGLGSLMVYTAFQLADDRTIVGYDGGFHSSARIAKRPSYSLKIGDDVYEFSRVDPLGTLLGWGADVRAYLKDQEDAPPAQREEGFDKLVEAAIVSTAHNMLSKTWLTSLKNLTELAGIDNENAFNTRLKQYAMSFGNRLVPGSGIQRAMMVGDEGVIHDASTFMEGVLKASVGADKLPVKRDYLLGRPVPTMEGERLFGVKQGIAVDNSDDPLLAEMERLSFDIPAASRTVMGVKLNSTQFNRWLELKGQVVTDPTTGLTLEGSLRELIKLPEYQTLPRAGKLQAVKDTIRGYSKRATEALFDEDKDFAYKAVQRQTFDALKVQGASQGQIDEQTQKFAEQLGLTPQ